MLTRPGMRCRRKGWTPTAGLWDYDGACRPGTTSMWNETFSVGVFQWVYKASGKGLKRGKTVKRIIGTVENPEAVYAKAEAYCLGKESIASDFVTMS